LHVDPEQILMTFFGVLGHYQRTNQVNFAGDLNPGPDSGFLCPGGHPEF